MAATSSLSTIFEGVSRRGRRSERPAGCPDWAWSIYVKDRQRAGKRSESTRSRVKRPRTLKQIIEDHRRKAVKNAASDPQSIWRDKRKLERAKAPSWSYIRTVVHPLPQPAYMESLIRDNQLRGEWWEPGVGGCRLMRVRKADR